MVKYEYNPTLEGFQRVDRRGRVLPINISEGRRIETLLKLGCSVASIYESIDFNKDVTSTTVRTFVKNYREGNISLEGDFPVPEHQFEEVTNDSRLTSLEDRVQTLEDQMSKINPNCFISAFATTTVEKENSWKNLWGLF